MIKMILATGENGELGLNGKLPWDCPEDLAYFKKCTLNKTVVMGRTTFESIPFEYGFPDRDNLVVSKLYKHLTKCHSVTWLNGLHEIDIVALDIRESWVIGGKSIYTQMLPYVQEIHHTTIKGDFGADVYFDTSFLEKWEHVSSEVLSEMAVVKVYRRKDGIG